METSVGREENCNSVEGGRWRGLVSACHVSVALVWSPQQEGTQRQDIQLRGDCRHRPDQEEPEILKLNSTKESIPPASESLFKKVPL